MLLLQIQHSHLCACCRDSQIQFLGIGHHGLRILPAYKGRLLSGFRLLHQRLCMVQRFLTDGLNAPDLEAVKQSSPAIQQLFRLLLDTGTLVRLKTYDRKSSMVLHRKVLSTLEQRLEEQFPYPQTFTVAEVRDLLNGLSDREREVLEMRFGLKEGKDHTLEEVGKHFGVTRERIRQIEAKALRKLRHPTRSRQLRDYLS